MASQRGERYYGFAYADKVSIGKDLNIEFDQQAAMEFCMAVLRAGMGMRHRPNRMWLRLKWDSQSKKENVDVGVFGYEEAK